MGDEFCKGCRECTNPNGTESNFSKEANNPITHLPEHIFHQNNGNITSPNENNSINNISFYGNNNYTNNNKDNNYTNKGDFGVISTINSKYPLNEGTTSLNMKEKGNEDLFGPRSSSYNGSTNLLKGKPPFINNSQNTNINNLNNNNNINFENDEDMNKLEQIITNYNVSLIISAFRKLKKLKELSHNKIIKEYSFLSGSDYVKNNENDLDVDLIPDKSYLYIGHKFNDKKDGYGLEIFSDSEARYFGRYRNGRRVDYGRFIINNETKSYIFNGEVNGVYAEGYGYLEDKIKHSKYYGMFRDSRKDGYGVEHYKDKSAYKGTFLCGKKDGLGFIKWTDKSCYQGEWKNDKFEGYGIYKFNDGSYYKGEWKENRMSGLGEFSFPGVKTFFGHFQKDSRTGFGILIWIKEEKAFIGFWEKNKENGMGKYITNRKIRYGIWNKGTLKEKIKSKEEFIEKLSYDERIFIPYFKIDDYQQILGCITKIIKHKKDS